MEIEIRKDLLSYRNVPQPVRVPMSLVGDSVDFAGGSIVEFDVPKEKAKMSVNETPVQSIGSS